MCSTWGWHWAGLLGASALVILIVLILVMPRMGFSREDAPCEGKGSLENVLGVESTKAGRDH